MKLKTEQTFEYELALDSMLDFEELKYNSIGRGAWYYPATTITERLNRVLGPFWSLKTYQPQVDAHNGFLSVNVDIIVDIPHLVDLPKIVRSSLSGETLQKGVSKKAPTGSLGNIEMITKSSATSALKKAASYFGVAYYLYDKDTIAALGQVFSTGGYDLTVADFTLGNELFWEEYDMQKYLELQELFIEQVGAEEWNKYVAASRVSFMNIKSFLFQHVTKFSTLLWKHLHSKRYYIER